MPPIVEKEKQKQRGNCAHSRGSSAGRATIRRLVLWFIVCQLDRAVGCSDIWTNLILGFSVRCCWMSLRFNLTDRVEQTALPNEGEPHLII